MKTLTEHTVDGVIRFIDETLHTLEAFEDSKRRSEYILEMVEEAIITTDCSATILSVNSFFEQKTGWYHDSIIGKNICDIIPSTFHKEIQRFLKFSKEGVFLNKEGFDIISHDGTEFHCKLSICRMVRTDGKTRYIFILK